MMNRRAAYLIPFALAAVLYLPWVGSNFVIDDVRNVVQHRRVQDGEIDQPHFFNFAESDQQVRADRAAARLPWLADDHVRGRFFRPVAELTHRLDFWLWGENPLLHRAVNVALYLLCVLGVYLLYTSVFDAKRLALWATIIFAVSSCHAIPALWVSNRCELLATIGVLTCVIGFTRFRRAGKLPWLGLSILGYLVALGSKEAAVPLPAVLLLVDLLHPERAAGRRRIRWAGLVVFFAIAAAYLVFYTTGGYGAVNSLYINPLQWPVEFLRHAPVRVLCVVGAWVTSINPLSLSWPQLAWAKVYYLVWAATWLVILLWLTFRLHDSRRQAGLWWGWAAVFAGMALCGPVGDRMLMLASVGWAGLVGLLVFGPKRAEKPLVARWLTRYLGLMVLVISPVATVLNGAVLFALENAYRNNVRQVLTLMPRVQPGDAVVLFNSLLPMEALWASERFELVSGVKGVRVYVLSFGEPPEMVTSGDHTLLVGEGGVPLFDWSTEGICRSPDKTVTQGDTFETQDFTAVVEQARNGRIEKVRFDFVEPFDSPRYHFFRCEKSGDEIRVAPVAL